MVRINALFVPTRRNTVGSDETGPRIMKRRPNFLVILDARVTLHEIQKIPILITFFDLGKNQTNILTFLP